MDPNEAVVRGVLTARDTLELPSSADAPRVAREFVTARAKALGLMADTEVLALLTSEIVTNAVKYSVAPRYLAIGPTDSGQVLVEVSDASPVPPVRKNAGPRGERGRGLWLVENLADGWGHEPVGPGKRVWFVLANPASVEKADIAWQDDHRHGPDDADSPG